MGRQGDNEEWCRESYCLCGCQGRGIRRRGGVGREIEEREGGEEGGRGRRERKGTRKEREREDEERGGGEWGRERER